MSRNLIIGIIVGVVVIVGGVAYFVSNKSDSNSQQNTSTQPSQPQSVQQDDSQTTTTNSNFFALSESGKPQICTFVYSGEKGSGDGTVYVDGDKRGLMKMNIKTEQGNTVVTNILVQTDKIYSWTTGGDKTFGMVFEKSTLEAPQSDTNASTSQSTQNMKQSYDMDCRPWTVDETVLAVPTNVNFTTLPSTN